MVRNVKEKGIQKTKVKGKGTHFEGEREREIYGEKKKFDYENFYLNTSFM